MKSIFVHGYAKSHKLPSFPNIGYLWWKFGIKWKLYLWMVIKKLQTYYHRVADTETRVEGGFLQIKQDSKSWLSNKDCFNYFRKETTSTSSAIRRINPYFLIHVYYMVSERHLLYSINAIYCKNEHLASKNSEVVKLVKIQLYLNRDAHNLTNTVVNTCHWLNLLN